MARKLSSFFSSKNICLDFNAHKKRDALHQIANMLSPTSESEASQLEETFIEREKLSPTGIGEGVAVPHVLREDVKTTTMAFLRVKKPLDWKSIDGQPVRLIFAMAGPKNDQDTHLRLLARLTRFVYDVNFREELLSASAPEEIIEAFARREKDAP